jgi:peptide/nickel transport system substrate-binding protein
MQAYHRLLALAALVLALAAPARAEQKVIRHVPQADLKVLDPVISQAWIVMQNCYLVYDQLFAWDSNGQPQPQMVDHWSLSPDQRTYTFTLRPGLKFQDGSPVRSADAMASIKRWTVKDPAGSKMAQLGMVLSAVDDNTFTLSLREPWGMTIPIMAKPSWALFVMRERDASNDANTPVTDNIGSGPFRFVRSEWVPGSKVVYERNPDYVPRAEPANFFSGGKVVKVDRVEWIIMPDAATAVAALTKGEVDSLEAPPIDLLPLLRKAPNVKVELHDHFGNIGMLRMNHLYPPFNNPKGREALLYMADQADYMQVAVGDPTLWRKCFAWLSCGGPESSEDGTADFHTPNLDKARELLKEAGYKGEKVVVMDVTGINIVPQFGQVTIARMKAIGLNVDVQTMEWSVMLARRLKTDPPDQGGWSVMHTYAPALDLLNPVAAYVLTAPCAKTGWPGWACDPQMEQLRDAYGRELDPAKRKEIAEQIQLEAVKLVPIVLLGQFFQPVAYRTNLVGMLEVPVPVMWNVDKK